MRNLQVVRALVTAIAFLPSTLSLHAKEATVMAAPGQELIQTVRYVDTDGRLMWTSSRLVQPGEPIRLCAEPAKVPTTLPCIAPLEIRVYIDDNGDWQDLGPTDLLD